MSNILYPVIRSVLFKLDPERAHELTLKFLQKCNSGFLNKCISQTTPAKPYQLFNLTFPNRVGLAAGFDKNGDAVDALLAMGFGFIEIGAVTPRAQPGNPKPRLFRFNEQQAVLNQFGFNNKGVDYLLENLKARKSKGIVGVNLGKNKDTPLEQAASDYLICMEKLYPYADFLTINISSPNTQGLRELQNENYIDDLLAQVKLKQSELKEQHQREVPLLVKVSPDLSDLEIQTMAELFLKHQIDGVIATNTTRNEAILKDCNCQDKQGGVSGAPLQKLSNKIIKSFRAHLGERIPILGVGGINSGHDAQAKIKAGASLVQVYSGLVFQGPRLIQEIVKAL